MPGITPPINISATDTDATEPKISIGILGGIMTTIVDYAHVIPSVTGAGYHSFSISFIIILPMLAVSACEEPDIPAKSILSKTFM